MEESRNASVPFASWSQLCDETLIITASDDTVFADLQPLTVDSTPSRSQIARWFY